MKVRGQGDRAGVALAAGGSSALDPLGRAQRRYPPTARLPDAGCRLMKLEGFHPLSARIKAALASLGLGTRLDVHSCGTDEAPQLVAYIRTPGGLIELD